jgi:hypothetical protein
MAPNRKAATQYMGPCGKYFSAAEHAADRVAAVARVSRDLHEPAA